jgi:hypothetical protein
VIAEWVGVRATAVSGVAALADCGAGVPGTSPPSNIEAGTLPFGHSPLRIGQSLAIANRKLVYVTCLHKRGSGGRVGCVLLVRLDVTSPVAVCALALCLAGFDIASRRGIGRIEHMLHLLLVLAHMSSFLVLQESVELVRKPTQRIRIENRKSWNSTF